MSCEAEMCANWTGDGCACALFGIEPEVVCVHGYEESRCLACADEC